MCTASLNVNNTQPACKKQDAKSLEEGHTTKTLQLFLPIWWFIPAVLMVVMIAGVLSHTCPTMSSYGILVYVSHTINPAYGLCVVMAIMMWIQQNQGSVQVQDFEVWLLTTAWLFHSIL